MKIQGLIPELTYFRTEQQNTVTTIAKIVESKFLYNAVYKRYDLDTKTINKRQIYNFVCGAKVPVIYQK